MAWVVLVSQAVGLVAVLVVLAVAEPPLPHLSRLLAPLVAGVAGLAGLVAFYRALAIGTMSIVAPIAAAGMGLPVAVGILEGERPGALRLLGMAATLVGVVLASRERDDSGSRSQAQKASVALALLAALGFGAFALGLRSGARADVVWTLVAARCGCLVPLTLGVLVARRGGGLPGVKRLAPVALIGLLDVSANALYAIATRHGLLSVVSVGASLYPLVTVLLARALLGERVRRSQEVGVIAALGGVVLIAAG